MIKNKKAQLIYRSIFLVFSFVGILGSFGLFKWSYNASFYLFFTNLSNYFCFAVVLTLLIRDIKDIKNGITSAETEIAPLFRFSVCVMIAITLVVYNVLLSNPFSAGYWTNFQSLIMHLICPVLYILDYLMFSKKRSINIFAPFYACIFPVIYLLFVMFRAEVFVGSSTIAYPYFFLNGYEIGWGSVAIYLLVMFVCILAFGYLLWAYDKLVKKEDNKLVWDFSKLPKPEPVEMQEEKSSDAIEINKNEAQQEKDETEVIKHENE